MGNEGGTWIMHGLRRNDPNCIHTVNEAVRYIDEVGFLPLFKNEIDGFSLEERTIAGSWWSEDPEKDPWEWRSIIARSGGAVYGKFFDNKAGFISKEWFPYFANAGRDGYDFDARWDDEKASRRQKLIMDLYAGEAAEREYFSYELKEKAGYGKDGEKGFDSTISQLQMMTYLCVRDFRKKKNKKGQEYGWPVAVYATPEHIFGRELVRAAYGEAAEESLQKIRAHIKRLYPHADEAEIRKVVG